MRMTRKIISIMLVAVMMLSIMPFNGLTALFAFAESNGSSISDGDIIEFGSYPQSKVTDSAVIASLDAAEKSWTSYGYYVGTSDMNSSYEFGTMVQSDFMKYADITLNSENYRAVKFTKYRPFLTIFKAEEDFTGTEVQYQNGYYTNNVYYFKYEPLQWKVLDADEGLIMSCNVIDSQAYCNYIAEYNGEYYGDSSYTNYASSYAGSSLRSWLNNDFYNTAFTSEQQLQIETTNLENLSTKSSAYDSAETNDKVFLLSYADVLNTEYGFNSDFSANDPARKLGSTDYAKCQGCYSSMEYENNSTCEKSYWWLRSPCTSYQAGEVVYDGFVDNCYPVYETDRGVVPAIKVTLEQETPSANKCGDNAFWSIENGTLTISGSGAIYDYEPGTHGPWNDSEDAYTSIVIESGITRIGEWAFAYSTATSVSIPDTVTSMGTAAFSGSALTSVTIPGSVETWQEAFVLCTSLQSVTIESGVEKIDVMSFGGCSSLQNVEIADTVSVIDSCAFQYCSSLEEITLADGVWMIAPDAFSGCSSLSAFAVSDNNSFWQVDNGVLFHAGSLFKYPAGKTDSYYRFPDDTNDVYSLAFEGCLSLTSIEFSASVQVISNGAFGATENLTDVFFRGSETEWQNIVIEDDNYYLENAHKHYNYDPNFTTGQCGENVYWTFDETTGTVTISGTGATYDYYDYGSSPFFERTDIRTAVIESGVTHIGNGLLNNCTDLQYVELPDTFSSQDYSFTACENLISFTVDSDNPYFSNDDSGVLFNKDKTVLIQYPRGNERTSYTVPNSVITIDEFSFYGSKNLTEVNISSNVTAVKSSAFKECEGLTSITIPSRVSELGAEVFASCGQLRTVVINGSITEILSNSFNYCELLESITVPSSVTSVGNYAFTGCRKLTDVYYAGSQTQWQAVNFGSGNNKLTGANIHYNYNPNVTTGQCGDNVFWSFDSSTGTLTITGTGDMYYFDPSPFENNKNIKKVVINSGVTSVGCSAFSGCENITEILLPDSMERINAHAFWSCQSLKNITIPGKVTKIDDMAFMGCITLKEITIPDSVTEMGYSVFAHCPQLKDVTIGGGITTLKRGTFEECQSIISITIPENVTSIAEDVFLYCEGLTSITISDKLTSIGNRAFSSDCISLTDVYYMGSEAQWQAITKGSENEKLLSANIHYNYDPNALGKAMANVPDIKTYYSDESVEELNAVLEEIYQGTENMTPQQIEDLIARLNEALANLELKSYQVNVPENCTATLSDVNGVNYKLATISAPATNGAGEKFVYWTDNFGNIVSTYRTYSFYVGSSADYTPVYASAENYDAAKEDALITSRVIDVKNNGDGNLIFLAEHSVSSSKDLNGHGLLVTADEALSSDGALIRGTDSDSIFDFNAQKTKNSRTGMIQVNAAVTGATVWARTYVIDTNGEIHYGKIQSYNTAALSSADDDMIFVDSAELSVANEEPPVDEPADSDSGFVSNLMSFIMNIIQMISVLINSILSIIK